MVWGGERSIRKCSANSVNQTSDVCKVYYYVQNCSILFAGRTCVREESFITRWGGGGRLHFHVVGKKFDDPPIPLEKNSRPPPQIYDRNVCDPPPPR